jgi:hypothetical protein
LVREPTLAITCTAPEQRYMGRPFDVCFTVVNKKGRIKDIQTYERAHRADLARKSKAEKFKGKA